MSRENNTPQRSIAVGVAFGSFVAIVLTAIAVRFRHNTSLFSSEPDLQNTTTTLSPASDSTAATASTTAAVGAAFCAFMASCVALRAGRGEITFNQRKLAAASGILAALGTISFGIALLVAMHLRDHPEDRSIGVSVGVAFSLVNAAMSVVFALYFFQNSFQRDGSDDVNQRLTPAHDSVDYGSAATPAIAAPSTIDILANSRDANPDNGSESSMSSARSDVSIATEFGLNHEPK